MLEANVNQQRPETTVSAIRALWDGLHIESCEVAESRVQQLLNALRITHSNGGAEFATFTIGSSTNLDWFMSRNQWKEIEFPERLLKSNPITSTLADVCKGPVSDSFGFAWEGAFTLSGEIAETLSRGGAYTKHPDAGDAFKIAEDFRKWLFGDRFEEVMVLKSYKPWSAWFYDVAWDVTWLVVDKRQRKVSVLAVTDTD